MGKNTIKWIEAEEMISEFADKFYDKFGVSITVHYNMKYRKVKKRINLRFVLDELNDYLLNRYANGVYRRGRVYTMENGIFGQKTRAREIVVARHMFCYIAYEAGYGPTEIAQATGEYYDHSTVIYAVKKIRDSLDINDNMTVELRDYVLVKMKIKYDDKGSYSEPSPSSFEE